jgi:glycogen debranching enzyme
MDPSSTASQGLFLADTRYLSTFQIYLNGERPILMASSEEILFQSHVIFTNPVLGDIPERGLGLVQLNTIGEEAVKITVTVVNWALKDVSMDLAIEVGSDFFDSFEARGVKRMRRGDLRPPVANNDGVELTYVGLDDVTRTTRITVKPDMEGYQDGRMHFPIGLKNGERTQIELELRMIEKAPEGVSLQPQPEIARAPKPPWFDDCTVFTTSNVLINGIIQRSIDDLQVLLTEFDDAWVPAAGLPRFSVPFGRDSLVTGLQTLSWNPRFSRDVLRFLAHRQGKEENPWNYEQPGKIMHEMHTGELARCHEVPFGLFYGSVDSTVLFLVLGAEYIRWTDDLELYRELKPNFDAAWEWIDKYGDIDGSGYVQYQAHTPPKLSSAALTVGLFNQGWKDSANSVTYADGSIVTDHPVALAEVQGDLYRALHLWTGIYDALPEPEGTRDRAAATHQRAEKLQEQFNREFWMEEKQYYAMGLDGSHRPIDSITSNPLECLWARLIAEEHVDALVAMGMSECMQTSWGIRTMANTEKAYNPFSYHNGSVWPFENALIAAGLKKYGLVMETQTLLDALVDASTFFEYRRWPEVYAGVGKRVGGVLGRQPDASRPQAWSAGAIFLLLQTILGVATPAFSGKLDITPVLPASLDSIEARNMALAGGTVSLRLVRDHSSVLMEIIENTADLDIVIHPAARNRYHPQVPHSPAVVP